MLIDVNKWIDKNGSFDEAGGLDLVRHGYEWIRRMRKFENKDETDGFVDTTGIVTSIKSKDVVEFYVENPFVKIKDE